MNNCYKRFFNSRSAIGFRLSSLSFDTSSMPASAKVKSPYPFLPFAWLQGDGSNRSVPLAPVASQAFYSGLMYEVSNAMQRSNATYPNPDNSVFYLPSFGAWENYMNQFIGDIGLFINQSDWQIANDAARTMTFGMIDQFWFEENANPDPPTLYARLYSFITGTLETTTDTRLWIPPGEWDFPGSFGSGGTTLNAAFADINVGDSQGLAMWVIELKSIA